MGRSFNRAITGQGRGRSSAIKVIPLESKLFAYDIMSLQGSIFRVSSSIDALFRVTEVKSTVVFAGAREGLG